MQREKFGTIGRRVKLTTKRKGAPVVVACQWIWRSCVGCKYRWGRVCANHRLCVACLISMEVDCGCRSRSEVRA